MKRTSALLVLLVSTSLVNAQKGGGLSTIRVLPPPPPVAPQGNIRPHGIPLITQPILPNYGMNLPNWGIYRGIYPYFGGYGYGYDYGYNNQPNIVINNNYVLPEPYVVPRNFATPPPVPNDHPYSARLTLQVPTNSEVWLQGKKVEGNVNRSFDSPALKSGESYTFDVRVTWLENGKQVEEKRVLVMKAGDHQNLQYISLPPQPVKVDQ